MQEIKAQEVTELPPLPNSVIVRNKVGIRPPSADATLAASEDAGAYALGWKPGEIQFDADQLAKFKLLHVVDGEESDEELVMQTRFSDNTEALRMIHDTIELRLGMTSTDMRKELEKQREACDQMAATNRSAQVVYGQFDELMSSGPEEIGDEEPQENFARRMLMQGRSFLKASSFKSFISQGEQEARSSKKVTVDLLNQVERDLYEEIFKKNWKTIGDQEQDGERRTTLKPVENFRKMKLVGLGCCKSENDQEHRAKRIISTLKYGDDYFVITKQFQHHIQKRMLTEHSNLLMQVAKLSKQENGDPKTARFELQHLRNIAVGDYSSADMSATKTATQFPAFASAAKPRCIDPSFISFVQRGHYIYFFIVGKGADEKVMQAASKVGSEGFMSPPMSFDADEQHEGGKKERGKKKVEVEEDEEDEEEEEEEEEDDEDVAEDEDEGEDDDEEVSVEQEATEDEQEDDSDQDGASEEADSAESDEAVQIDSKSAAATTIGTQSASKLKPIPDTSAADKAAKIKKGDKPELQGGMKDLANGDGKTAMSKSFFTKSGSLQEAADGGDQRDDQAYSNSQQHVGAVEDASEVLHPGRARQAMEASLDTPARTPKAEVIAQGLVEEAERFRHQRKELAEKEAGMEQERLAQSQQQQEKQRAEAEQARQEEFTRKVAEAEAMAERRKQDEEREREDRDKADRQRKELDEEQRRVEERARLRKVEQEKLEFKEKHLQGRLLDVRRRQAAIEDKGEEQKLRAAIFEEQMNQKFLAVSAREQEASERKAALDANKIDLGVKRKEQEQRKQRLMAKAKRLQARESRLNEEDKRLKVQQEVIATHHENQIKEKQEKERAQSKVEKDPSLNGSFGDGGYQTNSQILLHLCRYDLLAPPGTQFTVMRKNISISGKKQMRPLAVVFAQKLEENFHYHEEQSEADFLDEQIVSIIYSRKDDFGLQSIRCLGNIERELFSCEKHISLKRPYGLFRIKSQHPHFDTKQPVLVSSFEKTSNDGDLHISKVRARTFLSWSIATARKDEMSLFELAYPKTLKALLSSKVLDDQTIGNVKELYQLIEDQVQNNHCTHYTFQTDYKHAEQLGQRQGESDTSRSYYQLEIKSARIAENFRGILHKLRLSPSRREEHMLKDQTFNTIIDHINQKCFIIRTVWEKRDEEDGGGELVIIEGDLPKAHFRDQNDESRHIAPLNQYLNRIFEERGDIPNCLSLNSSFKNVIKDIDGIHFFLRQQDAPMLYKKIKVGSQNEELKRQLAALFHGNFVQEKADANDKHHKGRLSTLHDGARQTVLAGDDNHNHHWCAKFIEDHEIDGGYQKLVIDDQTYVFGLREQKQNSKKRNGPETSLIVYKEQQESYAPLKNNFKIIPQKIHFLRDSRTSKTFLVLQTNDNQTKVIKLWLVVFDIKGKMIQGQQEIDLTPTELKDIRTKEGTGQILSKNFKISPSSAPSYVDGSRSSYCQNYQVSICFEHLFRFKILEFKVTIMETAPCSKELAKSSIDLVAHKELIRQINNQNSRIENYELLPLFDSKGQLQVRGTTLLINYGDKRYKFVNMQNFHPSDFLKTDNPQPITRIGYKRYRMRNTYKYENLLVEARMNQENNKRIDKKLFTYYDKTQILANQIHTLLNMVPLDFVNIIESDQNLTFDYFQNLEALQNGKSLCHFNVPFPQVINNEYTLIKQFSGRDQRAFMGLLAQTLENDPTPDRHQNFLNSEMLRQPNQISYDFEFRTPIDECIKEDNLLMPSLEIIFEHVMEAKNSQYLSKLAMRNMKTIVNLKEKCAPFFKFFARANFDAEKVNFEQRSRRVSNGFSEQQLLVQSLGTRADNSGQESTSVLEAFDDIQEEVGRTIKDNRILQGMECQVDHTFIDLRQAILQNKLDRIADLTIQRVTPSKCNITKFDVADMIHLIQQHVPEDIEQQEVIQHLIDYEFETNTAIFFRRQFILYSLSFFIPFTVQSFMAADTAAVIACHAICTMSSIFFFTQELIQIKEDRAYLRNEQNILDLFGNVLYWAYMIKRLTIGDYQLPLSNKIYDISTQYGTLEEQKERYSTVWRPSEADHKSLDVRWAMVLLNVLVLLIAFIKMHLLARFSERFGMLVQLLMTCVYKITSFTVFFFIWIFAFSFFYQILDMEIPLDDYPDLYPFLAYALQTYRNSIGDISPPTYPSWEARLTTEPKAAHAMITAIWVFWFLNQLLVLIILLNFLIAIISQSFEEVMAKKVIHKYQHRSTMNREYRLIAQAFGFYRPVQVMIISCEEANEDQQDWAGIVSTIKHFITSTTLETEKKHALKLDELATSVDGKLKDTADDVKKHVKKTVTQLEEHMSSVQSDMKQQRVILAAITQAIQKNKKI